MGGFCGRESSRIHQTASDTGKGHTNSFECVSPGEWRVSPWDKVVHENSYFYYKLLLLLGGLIAAVQIHWMFQWYPHMNLFPNFFCYYFYKILQTHTSTHSKAKTWRKPTLNLTNKYVYQLCQLVVIKLLFFSHFVVCIHELNTKGTQDIYSSAHNGGDPRETQRCQGKQENRHSAISFVADIL